MLVFLISFFCRHLLPSITDRTIIIKKIAVKRKNDWRKPPIGSVKASFPCTLYKKITIEIFIFGFTVLTKQNNKTKKVMRVKQLV